MYLVIFKDNHNDEFDVNGFKIMTEKEVNNFEDLAVSIAWEFNFNANGESLTYSNGEDFLSRIEFKIITKNEYDTIEKVFGGEFGTFIGEEYLQLVFNGDTDSDYTKNEDEDEDY